MEINLIAIIVAALVPMALGFIWYHSKVFGTVWMNAAGMTEEKIKSGNMALIFGLSFLFSIMLAMEMNSVAIHDAFIYGATYYATNRTMQPEAGSELAQWVEYYQNNLAASNHTFAHGSFHGMLFGIFLALPVMATNALFERKSFKYVAVNVGYWIVCLAIMGGIVAAWR
ncbi:MAG: DUF1761 domain-containing protein [Lewinellaceae bacterium]|nr:DUF1761 domain-containing protein [Saprospiraceae bacterium]MCB9330949.1 DUF1761 domain-containing protein [Lewinellaceae bacterium]